CALPISYAYHNLGHVHLLTGDYTSAYEAFYKVTSLAEGNNELKSANDASLGAVSILRGDYKLAGLHLNNAPENETNLFNKGLAFLLAEDYRNARNAFERSEEHTSELQSRENLVCRLLLEK